ncbi:MAG TPA: ATP-binding protein, partial [Ilumatobacteraceae bacterium]
AVLHVSGETRLAYALHSSTTPTVVVFRETKITPEVVAATVRGQAFGDVNASLYAAPTPDLSELVLSTANPPQTTGQTIKLTIGADTWLLVTNARGALVTGWLGASPWIVFASGLLLTLFVGAFVETVVRRRGYALALVDERTADLRSALAERSALEAGQRLARQEAEAASHAKSEFLSRMSHELRTPLNGVLGFAQLMQMDQLTEGQQDSLSQILKGGWHLLGLINEVLDITKIETGNTSLSPEPVLACKVIEESVDLIRSLADQIGIHLITDSLPGCDVHIYADRQRVKQILLNLLSNAVKYNRAGGSVAINCKTVDEQLLINVVDTGPGIHEESLSLLFVPFERLGAEHGDVEGTGIGLALSQRLADAMSGTLTVDTAIGRGSTFTLTLPIVEGPVERFERLGVVYVPERGSMDGDAESDLDDSPKHKVLYIEDNMSNLRLVRRLLEFRDDVEIVAAMQGRLGLELARQHKPTVVLLDLHLPDTDGAEVLRKLKNDPVTQHIPVIIVSADATPGQVSRLRHQGAHAYLTKPLDVPELMRVLSDVLAAHPL